MLGPNVIGYIEGWAQKKSRRFWAFFLGPKRDINGNGMEAAQILKTLGVTATNPEWKNFGPPTGAKKHCLENLGPLAKKNRQKWQDNLSGTPLPSGPYPVHLGEFG